MFMQTAFHKALPVMAAASIAKLFAVAISRQTTVFVQLLFFVSVYMMFFHGTHSNLSIASRVFMVG